MANAWALVFGPERSSGAIIEFPDSRRFVVGERLDLDAEGTWRIAEIRKPTGHLPQLLLDPVAPTWPAESSAAD
jgi:hypothetical protein